MSCTLALLPNGPGSRPADLAASLERQSAALAAARTGTWRWEIASGRSTHDPNMSRLLGRPAVEATLPIQDVLGIVHPEDRAALAATLDRVLRGEGADYEAEFRVIWPDGTIRWLKDQGKLVRDEADRPQYLTGISVDITERRRAEEELRRHNEQLAEADRRKDEFLAMLAHELRNPLAAIAGALRLAEGSEADPEDHGWALGVIDRQVRHLNRLIDDLLDVSRISRGKVQLRTEPLDLAPLVARAAEAVRPLIEARGHALSIALAPGPLRLVADPTRLEQVLVNLLSNAAKYTEEGGRIALEARRAGDQIVVAVSDNGIGIPPEMLPQIFELFTQVERSLDRSQGGLGIGLTLVKSLVELHGGSVAVASEGPGRGSTFTLRLPAAAPGPAPRPEPARAEPTRAQPGRRILVVDDNPDLAQGLSKLLTRSGHRVRTVHDGPSALEAARTEPPEVVLLDLSLPGLDGYQVARALRREAGLDRALIIAISGYAREQDRRRSHEASCDHHLVKPVDFDALLALLGHPEAGEA
ncbi:MAG: response regulator [Isosphaeraceae bacterium]|nr:response regulator [Isosphaeraceae bacterium]